MGILDILKPKPKTMEQLRSEDTARWREHLRKQNELAREKEEQKLEMARLGKLRAKEQQFKMVRKGAGAVRQAYLGRSIFEQSSMFAGQKTPMRTSDSFLDQPSMFRKRK